MPSCGFEEMGINEYMSHLRNSAYENRIPFKGVLELTPRCNFNCNMCYVHLRPDQIPKVGCELSKEQWIRIARSLQQAGTLELTITGGEPFVRPDFREIYEAVHDMGFLIQIFSNGSLITEENIRWLQARPPQTMRFTLYGASDETYEKVCGISHGFSRVQRSIEMLHQAGIPLYLVATITRENQQELERMYRLAAKYRLPMIHTSSLINPVRGATAEAKRHQVDYLIPSDEEIRRIRQQNKGKFPRKPCKDFLEVCGNYRKGFWITWNGRLQLCAFLEEPSVALRPESFVECWNQLLEKVELLKQPEECASCQYERYCERCPGLLYAENGGCNMISPEFCERARYNYLLYGKPMEETEKKGGE